MVNIAVIGAGAMGADHAQTLSESVPGAAVVAIADPDPRRAMEVAARVGARTSASGAELIAAADVDAVIIAGPDAVHAPLTLACIRAGKPVLCEKPLGTAVAETDAVVAAEVSAGRRLVSLGFMRRYDPAHRSLRDVVTSRQLGEPLAVHQVHRNRAPHQPASVDSVITNSMVHEFDMLPWLLGGRIRHVAVHSPALTAARYLQLATVRMSTGALATIEVFLAAGYGYDVRCEVVGAQASARLRAPGQVVLNEADASRVGVAADFRERFADAYRLELLHWVRAVTAGKTLDASAWDGHRANLAAAAALASLHQEDGVSLIEADRAVPEIYRTCGS